MRPRFGLGLGNPASRAPTYMGYPRSPSLEACDARWRVCVLGLLAEVNFQEAVGGFEAARPRAQRLRRELPQEDVVFNERPRILSTYCMPGTLVYVQIESSQ